MVNIIQRSSVNGLHVPSLEDRRMIYSTAVQFTSIVVVKIKFTFCNHTTIVQRSSYGTKTVQKTVLNYYYVSVYAHRFYGTQA